MKDWVFRNRNRLASLLYIIILLGIMIFLVSWQQSEETIEVSVGDPYTGEFIEVSIPEGNFSISSEENGEIMVSLGLYSEDESGEFEEIGRIGVDSGIAGIESEDSGSFYVTAGYGDGVYPVFVRTGENGTVNAVEVRFI